MRQIVIEVEDGIDITVLSVTAVMLSERRQGENWINSKCFDPFWHRMVVVNDEKEVVTMKVVNMDGSDTPDNFKICRPPKYRDEVGGVKQCSGEGQGSCKRCSDNGKWNRAWMCFLYKVDGMDGCYCYECAKKIEEERNREN